MSTDPSQQAFPPELQKGSITVLRILWIAFIATQGVFATIYSIAAPTDTADPERAMTMLPIFLGIALFMAGISLFGLPLYAAKAGIDYRSACLFRFATSESIGIFGLTLGFLGLEIYPFGFFVAAALILLLQAPGNTDYQRYRQTWLDRQA
ncbi:MAG TPA: hypothetical protein ENJ18_13605 [Nannocystis exedens]|nr:hypothetical protein [Nannocystis exedens]